MIGVTMTYGKDLNSKKKILLIVPCFNEASRIDLDSFEAGKEDSSKYNLELHFLFVDDGSVDQTPHLLSEYCKSKEGFYFHRHEVNQGKGNAIQKAYQNLHRNLNFKSYEWIGYWDADLATPLSELKQMINYLAFFPAKNISAVWGSRISRLGSQIKRQLHRHYLGRIFVTIVSNVLNVKAYDSQCGAKIFKKECADIAFKEPFISRWIFDVEILLRIKEDCVIEYPLLQWEDIPGSKVKVFKEIFRVGSDLYKIRNHYLS